MKNKMGKTRDLSRKIRDTNRIFHASSVQFSRSVMSDSLRPHELQHAGTIKDRNDKDLTEAEGIKKRWQDYTEELYKIDFHDPDNHGGVTMCL